ncbi:MAG: response regulator transcription factor [Lachnospiraceae bacterium]|nr:response regulator transcription factor [Candidatus Equihabitans merdae]
MRALIVEDDRHLSNNICESMKDMLELSQAFDGEQGLKALTTEKFDIVILDVMMPKMDGFEVLSAIRAQGINTPVLMLTALNQATDQVRGLKAGADDYLAKPFDISVLRARIEALLRRTYGAMPNSNILKFIDLVLDMDTRIARIDGQKLELRGKQFDLLRTLVKSKNVIMSKELVFQKVWGFYTTTELSVVDVYASQLRKELRKFGYDQYLKTIRGVGLLLTDDEEIYG